MPPQPLGNDTFVRCHKHDEGLGFRGQHGFRDGCLMFLGIPLDLGNTENIRAAVNTFGKFQHWVEDDPYMVRSIVFASFPEDI
uniref:RRM domain-containing protein n=1 Tax=Aegilops tauschii subsp. strangulata TaxID=200361 RepID=A0A453RVW3_AEGTS